MSSLGAWVTLRTTAPTGSNPPPPAPDRVRKCQGTLPLRTVGPTLARAQCTLHTLPAAGSVACTPPPPPPQRVQDNLPANCTHTTKPVDPPPPPPPHSGRRPVTGLRLHTDPAALPPLPILEPASDPGPTAATAALLAPLPSMSLPVLAAAGSVDPVPPTTLDSVPIPTKLRCRILDLEFVKMHDLLPEVWEVETSHSCCPGSRRQTRRGPVQDILLWTECFSSLVAILGSAHPDHIADFMAYQRSIVRASRIFEGTAWVVYDRCYRRRAALTKDLNWSVQHTAPYNEAFTGRACTIPRCTHCLSENHAVGDCPDRPQGLPHHSRQALTGLYEPPATARQPQPPPSTAGSSTRSGAALGGAATCTSAAIARYLTLNRCAQTGEITTPASHPPRVGAAPTNGLPGHAHPPL